MKIEEAQELIREIYLERDRERGVERILLRTFQELAELSDKIHREKPMKDIEEEVADVFAWLISIANLLDVNLGDALVSKYDNRCSRCKMKPCECSDNR
jgi:NTP pyrophosphatase (non-canonical NTP hydrolase)